MLITVSDQGGPIVDAQRQAFLEGIEADLTAPKAVATGQPKKLGRKVSAVAAAAFAGVSFFAASAGAASASPSVASDSCFAPEHKPYNHSHFCRGVTVMFEYAYTWSPNGGIVHCYHFNVTVFSACGSGPAAPQDSCA
jgi:hypothetical protein